MAMPYEHLLRVGKVLIIFKALMVCAILLAIYSDGIRRIQPLWLGVEVLPVSQTIREQFGINRTGGVLINRVIQHSPAGEARLRRGDVILNLDHRPVYEANDIRGVIADRRSRDPIRIVYLRDGVVFSTKASLDFRPASAQAGRPRSPYHYHLTANDALALLALGMIAGAITGMLGCGGGVLQVSLLIIFFGFEIVLAKVLSLISCAFMSMSSSYSYLRSGLADRKTLYYLIPSGVLGACIGAAVSFFVSRHVLEIALGFFLLYTALETLHQIMANAKAGALAWPEKDADKVGPVKDPSLAVLAGFPLGLSSALLGVTGGVLGTPLQRAVTKAPLRTCIANTLVASIFVSLIGGGVLMAQGLIQDHFSFRTCVLVLLAIVPGSLVGGRMGATLNRHLPISLLRGFYAVVVLVIAYKLLILG